MNIAVYLGASKGNNPAFEKAICQLGTWIAENGHTLVYGGSKTGLMGELAESVYQLGGTIIGVEPQCFIDQNKAYEHLTKLIITQDIPERKTKMIELSDAFIAFPGGTGTLEEISEVIAKVALNDLDAPCILYNLNEYYEPLKELLNHMIDMEFSSKDRQKNIYFPSSLEDIQNIISNSVK